MASTDATCLQSLKSVLSGSAHSKTSNLLTCSMIISNKSNPIGHHILLSPGPPHTLAIATAPSPKVPAA